MPLQAESLIKIFRGTRRLGNGRPVLIVTGDTMDSQTPLSEFFLFHDFPDMPFLYSRTICTHPDGLYLYDFAKYPGLFSARALLDKQLRAAQDRLEHEVYMRDPKIAGEIFYSSFALAYEDTGDTPLIEFAMFQKFIKERDVMFKFSRSHAVSLLKDKLLEFPEAVLLHEPRT
jgi:hypothetical protein